MLTLRSRTLVLVALLCALTGHRSLGQSTTPGVEGIWQGALGEGASRLRVLLRITKAADGAFDAKLDSLDQGSTIPIAKVSVAGEVVNLDVPAVGGTYQGTLSSNRSQLTGTWTQLGRPQPLVFTRQELPAAQTSAPPVLRRDAPLIVDVPAPPVAFQADGKTHLVYELHITNISATECGLVRVEAAESGDATAIGVVEGVDLAGRVVRPGATGQIGADALRVGAGLRAVVFMWLTLGSAPQPRALVHRIGFVQGAGSFQLTTVPVPVGREVPVIGAPLAGGDWMAANGPDNASVHRRALIPIDGRAWIAQRFAIDWVRIRDDGRTFTGDVRDNKSYRAYGAEALAVADASVAATKDGIPENVPGPTSRAVPITLETIGGNHVILDLGGGRFAFYAHLQPGSLRVKVGERVKRGQVLGLVGNSGNSTEPHLHFHVADRNSALASDGLPYALDSFEVQGTGPAWRPASGQGAEKRTRELPMANAVVRFAVK